MSFENELKKKLNGKYEYLKLLKVVYNTSFSHLLVNFIYPEDKPIFTDSQKAEIKTAVSEILNIKGNIDCKFNKSYLDKNIVFKSIFEFVKKNFDSISAYFNENTLEYDRNALSVQINIRANKTLVEYINSNNITETIKKHLLKNFCGDFIITTSLGEEDFDDSMLEERAIRIQNQLVPEVQTPRYKVSEPMVVFGSEIMPLPEYISNLKGEKISVILGGVVSDLVEKEYLPRKNKEKGIDEKRKYYTFKLDDGSGKVSCIHFCTKTSQKHFKLVEDGTFIICKGDYNKKTNGEMQYMIKAISLCHKIEEQLEGQVAIDIQPNKEQEAYKFVIPQPYTRTIQNNLFDVQKDYPDFIKDKEYVVFDVETTGLDADKNDITEIGAVKIVNGEITEKFQSLCKPFEQIPQNIISLTGITNEMVENQPLSTDIIQDFLTFTKGATLVGYNVHFDLNFIQNVAKRINKSFSNEIRDCLMDARVKLTTLPNYKLKTLVSHLGITLDNAHRALYDATATAEAFLALSLM